MLAGILASAAACTTKVVPASSGVTPEEPTCEVDCGDAEQPAAEEPDDDEAAPTAKDAGTKKKDGGASKPTGDGGADGGPDSATQPPPAPTVGGATVAECQGKATLSVDFDGKEPKVKTGFAIYTQGHYEVYLYSRPLIDDYGYGGSAGEIKTRLILGGPTGTANQYQGMFGVFEWSTVESKWTNLATPTETTLVDIANYQVVDPTGLMCNGRLSGMIQALFSPNTVAVAAFDVPILTATFPKSKAGPP